MSAPLIETAKPAMRGLQHKNRGREKRKEKNPKKNGGAKEGSDHVQSRDQKYNTMYTVH